jgi:hypothetical protein
MRLCAGPGDNPRFVNIVVIIAHSKTLARAGIACHTYHVGHLGPAHAPIANNKLARNAYDYLRKAGGG